VSLELMKVGRFGDRSPGVPALLPYSYGSGLGGGQVASHAAGPGNLDVLEAGGDPLARFDDRPAVERELKRTVTGEAAQGQGGTFRLRPRWPSADQLDYVQKFTTASLLSIALLLLFLKAIKNPAGALNYLVTGAKRRAGVG
jgi:hypothetical protein